MVIMPIILMLLIGLILLSAKLAVGSQAHKIENVWMAFAEQMKWIGEVGQGNLIVKLSGEYRGYGVVLIAYVSDGGRSNPVEYVDVIVEIDNPLPLRLYSNLWEPLLGRQIHIESLPRVKSGEPLFDLQYTFQGSPEAITEQILHKPAVRNYIKALYPTTAPIFEHPMLQVEGGKMAIRKYQSYTDRQQLTILLDKVADLAQALEAE